MKNTIHQTLLIIISVISAIQAQDKKHLMITLCAWEDRGTDPPRSYAKAHVILGGN